jgi:hypothetical protein
MHIEDHPILLIILASLIMGGCAAFFYFLTLGIVYLSVSSATWTFNLLYNLF